jgi:enamine deaminase RidA (YjgF/YER057c/UK114 family)
MGTERIRRAATLTELGTAWGYSRAVRAGDRIEVSGTGAWNPDGSVFAPGDPYRQTLEVFRIMSVALADLGAALDDVIRTRAFLVEIDEWQDVARAHVELFGQIRPASTCIGGAVLLDPDLRVEIEASAIVTE